MDREALLSTLRGFLREALAARFSGTAYAKLAQATSHADGYMRALLDAGIVERDDLLAVVADERRRFVEADSPIESDRNAA